MHNFKMRSTQLMTKKIDLHQKTNFGSISRSTKRSSFSLSTPQKLSHPSFRTARSNSARPSSLRHCINTLSNQLERNQEKHQHKPSKADPEYRSSTQARVEDKTYNNNYKLFPMRNHLKRAYVVQNSDIVINIFSKKLEMQEMRNSILAKKLILQLKRFQQNDVKTQSSSPVKRATRTSYRIESARSVPKVRQLYDKFTPWEVLNGDYPQQL